MKSTIQNINENPAFVAAQQIRERLTASIAEAQAIAEAASAKFHSVELPLNNIENALQIMDGGTARTLNHGLALEQAEAVAKVKIFKEALTEQNQAINSLISNLSGELSQNLRGEHAGLVSEIASALASLGNALRSEQDMRDRMEAAGYRCTFPSFQSFDLGSIADQNSLLSNLHRAASDYAQDVADELSGKLDKPIVIRLLADCYGAGAAGDVIEFDGKHARQLVRLGRAEPTSEKLRRLVPKPAMFAA